MSAHMADRGFRWAPQDASGRVLPETQSFATQEEAEAWLAGAWEGLLAEGADEVTLRVDERVVYRMGLRES